jgi:uncharacterized protein
MKKWLKNILLTVAVLYIIICAAAYFFQEKLTFFPDKNTAAMPAIPNLKNVKLKTIDGIELDAWYLNNNKKYTILYSHGNGGNISYYNTILKLADSLNCNVLLYDYRGYGLSKGKISKEQDLYNDIHAAHTYLKKQNVADSNLIIYGYSLGGGVSAELATKTKCKLLVLQNTFSSAAAIAKYRFPFLPIYSLFKYPLNTVSKLNNHAHTILIFHSKEDEVIPYNHAIKLYNSASEPFNLYQINGNHSQALQQSFNTIKQTMAAYINK